MRVLGGGSWRGQAGWRRGKECLEELKKGVPLPAAYVTVVAVVVVVFVLILSGRSAALTGKAQCERSSWLN